METPLDSRHDGDRDFDFPRCPFATHLPMLEMNLERIMGKNVAEPASDDSAG